MSLTLIETREQRRFSCGPLEVRVRVDDPTLRTRLTDALSVYSNGQVHRGRIDIWVRESAFRHAPVAGSYAAADRLNVDATPSGLVAVADSGASGECIFTDTGDYWKVDIPASAMTPLGLADLERLVELALRTGWRRRGYVPISAAGVVSEDGRCAIITSSPNGGTTTLAAALVRNGWRSLGDRILLLRANGRGARLDAVLGAYSLHPDARAWFPEVGRLDYLPRFPSWTEKRRVVIEHVWPSATMTHAVPTHIVSLQRSDDREGTAARVLPRPEALRLLLQSADVPKDPSFAKPLGALLATAARSITPVSFSVAAGAYADRSCAELFAAFLR